MDFLNKRPAKALGKMRDEATQLTYTRLRFGLEHFLAPTVWVPREVYKNLPAEREKETAFIKHYGPKVGLITVVEELNRQAVKPHWRMVEKPFQKIAVPGFTGIIEKREFRDPLWPAIARLLETSDILGITLCLVCKKFFVKNRPWQEICPKPACRKTHDADSLLTGKQNEGGNGKA